MQLLSTRLGSSVHGAGMALCFESPPPAFEQKLYHATSCQQLGFEMVVQEDRSRHNDGNVGLSFKV